MPWQIALYSREGSPAVGSIVFSDLHWVPEFGCRCAFSREGEEWSVELTMIEPYQCDVLGFFEEMARDSAGWLGMRSWSSEYAEVDLRAANDGRAVTLDVTMRWSPDWEPRRLGSIDVDPAELPRVADDMKRFVGLERGERFRAS